MSFLNIGSLKETFDKVLDRIRAEAKHFEAEARLAHAVSTETALDKISSALPQLDVLPEGPESAFLVPWSRNSKFFERNKELELIWGLIAPHPSEQMSCVLHGMAGVGKSQVALEFAFRQRQTYPYIFWIPSGDGTVLAQAFAKISGVLGLCSGHKGADLALQVEKAQVWLCQSMYTNAPASHDLMLLLRHIMATNIRQCRSLRPSSSVLAGLRTRFYTHYLSGPEDDASLTIRAATTASH